MKSKYTVKLKTIAEEHNLTVLHASKNYDTAVLTTADLNRPALQLTGFYNYFDPKRLRVALSNYGRKRPTRTMRLRPYEAVVLEES